MALVSAGIAVMLLCLYGYAIWLITHAPTQEPSEPVSTILGLVGGLVSALVIAVLATTPPATNPARAFAVSPGLTETIASAVVAAYLIGWLACGGALLLTWMRVPNVTPVLSAAAKTWFGLAVAAAYAYLGLKR